MKFQLLGPVDLYQCGQARPLGGPRQRAVLVALLLHANEEVATNKLLELVWSDVPSSARSNLRTYLTRLRRILRLPGEPESRLQTRRGGHMVTVQPGELDVATFTDLAARGEQSADALAACRYFERALGTWHGRALENVALGPMLEAEATQLEARRERVYEQYLQAKLSLGQHAELLPELRAQLLRNPLWERPASMLMVALDRSGQRSEALTVFRRMRKLLIEELGVEPSAELRELHRRLLAGEDSGSAVGRPSVSTAKRDKRAVTDTVTSTARPPERETRGAGKALRRVSRRRHRARTADHSHRAPFADRAADSPAQLPVDLPTFSGRSAELAELLGGESRRNRSIIAIDGMAGVGKTTLAVHAAHLLAAQFPDGQLFLDLHGHTQGVRPLDPHEALDQLLRLFGVPTNQFPATEVRASMYRSLLAHRKMLVVLDNAQSEAQVSPLLPGAGASRTIVTSRKRLTGLRHAHPLSVDVLPPAEAVTLFGSICTPARLVGQPPELVEEIVELCGRLPLAIWIAAGRLRNRRFWTPVDLRERLIDQQQRLTELHFGEHGVAAAFNLSLADLEPVERQVITALGLYPGTSIELNAAAALAGLDVATTDRVLEQLVDAHLLRQRGPTRYELHNLMRAFMIQRAQGQRIEERRDAVRRLLDYYLHTADAADQLLQTVRTRTGPSPADPVVVPLKFAAIDEALAWCDQVRPDFLHLIGAAERYGLLEHLWQFTVRMEGYIDLRHHWVDGIAAYEIALDAARRLADRPLESELLMGLAFGATQLEQYEQAISYHTAALSVCGEIGSHYTEGLCALALAKIHRRLRHHDQAVAYHRHALEIYQRVDDASAICVTLDHLGDTYREMGQLDPAIECYRQALRYSELVGDDYAAARYLIHLGEISNRVGRHDEANSVARRALTILARPGDQYGEAHPLAAPKSAAFTGETEARAWLYLNRAQEMLIKLTDGRADDLRTYLARLDCWTPIVHAAPQ